MRAFQLNTKALLIGLGALSLALGSTACGSSSSNTNKTGDKTGGSAGTGGSGSTAAGGNGAAGTDGKDGGTPGVGGDFSVKVVEKVEAPKYLEGIEVKAQDIFREGVRAVVRENNLEKAATKFREASVADPGFLEAYFNLGMALERLNKRDEALAVYNEALAKNPDDPTASAYIAKLYLGKARAARLKGDEALDKSWSDKAFGLLEPLVGKHPRNVAVNNAMALYHLSKGDTKTAQTYVKEVLFVEPRNVTGLNTRGLINLKNKKYRIAEWIFLRKVLVEDPNSTEALTNLGFTYIQMDRRPEAMKFFKRALALDPNNMDVRMNIAAMLLEHLNYKEANNHYTIVHKAEPKNLEAYEGMCDSAYGMSGDADDSNKQYEAGIQCYLGFVAQKPERTDLYQRIAQTYQNKIADGKKAIEFFEMYLKKAKLDPKEATKIQGTIKVLKEIEAKGGLKAMQGGGGDGDGGDGGDGDGDGDEEGKKPEEVKPDAAKTEPAKTEPAKTEPAKTEPAKAEPAKTEPAKAEPAKTDAK